MSTVQASILSTVDLTGTLSVPEKYTGPQGKDGESAYQIAVDLGFLGTEQEWLDSLQGEDGLSAYEVAKALGYEGTEEEWLASLKGADGVMKFSDLTDEQKESLRGPAGKDGKDGQDAIAAINPMGNYDENTTYSIGDYVTDITGDAYVCRQDGVIGQEPIAYPDIWQLIALKGADGQDGQDGLQGLPGDKGESAYEIAVDQGYEGTEAEWLASLKGDQGEQGIQGIQGEKGDTGDSYTITDSDYSAIADVVLTKLTNADEVNF